MGTAREAHLLADLEVHLADLGILVDLQTIMGDHQVTLVEGEVSAEVAAETLVEAEAVATWAGEVETLVAVVGILGLGNLNLQAMSQPQETCHLLLTELFLPNKSLNSRGH